MSRFEQLQSAHAAATAANIRYWSQMHQTLRGVQSDFSEYLGIGPHTSVSLNGANTPVVTIGSFDEKNNYLPWAIEKLPQRSRNIDFALRLAFGTQTSSVPAPVYVIHLSLVGIEDGLFTITVIGLDETEFKGPVFTALYDDVFKRVMSTMKS